MIIFSRAESLVRKREHSTVAMGFMMDRARNRLEKGRHHSHLQEGQGGGCRLVSLATAPGKITE